MTPPANEITRPVCVAVVKFDVGTPTASATRPKPTRDMTSRNAEAMAIRTPIVRRSFASWIRT